MNVAVINIKDITKYIIKLLIIIFIIYVASQYISKSGQILGTAISDETSTKFLTKCLKSTIPVLNTIEEYDEHIIKISKIMNVELAMLSPDIAVKTEPSQEAKEEQTVVAEGTKSPAVEIPKNAEIEAVTEKNYVAGSNFVYGTTKIDNESKYTITTEMLDKEVEITNKKDIVIFHTHTCESYTPCEKYNYTMTGNYRTTDSNYNMVRIGRELKTYLNKKGFNVIHDETYHDYQYSGSYSRSLETVENLLAEKSADIVIDLHRDAVGNGDTYGPTVMINGESVAQLMFVIGTDGGGLEHPNWIENLKIAIMIQEKANEMYPGLFRPIIVRNSRYNQHTAKGACIIEVGATANTLDEAMLSMQCLANVFDEVCK